MARRDHKNTGGRPRGASKQLDRVRSRIAAGENPLTAFALEGYHDPKRALKHHAASVAEARRVDPEAVLQAIAVHGCDADKLPACRDLLDFVDEERAEFVSNIFVMPVDARTLTAKARTEHPRPCFTLPRDLSAALTAWDDLRSTAGQMIVREGGVNPIAILEDIIVRNSAKDSVLRQTAVQLIKTARAKRAAAGAADSNVVFCLPVSHRVPWSAVAPTTILLTAEHGVDPVALFHAALEARQKSAATVAAGKHHKETV